MAGRPGSGGTPEEYRDYFATASRQGDVPDEDADEFADAGDAADWGTDADAGTATDRHAGDAPHARALAAGVRAVDPARSRIVLIGAPAYDDPQLPNVPQVARNLGDLAAVFTDPKLGGFPAKHCVSVPPNATVAEVGDILDAAAEEAEDLLLFYFAGHGLIGARGELYLALQHTRFRNPGYSGLRFDTIRDTFLHLGTKAKNRAVIIDSCFSGRAIGPTLASGDGALADGLEINGSYTLASAPSNSLALVKDGEAHTAFTGRLLELLREGSTQIGDLISLREIYQHLLARMRADGLPLPQMRGTATADRLGLVRNVRPAPLVPAQLPRDIRDLLENGRPRVRQAGVEELAVWLASSDPRQVLAARTTLEQVIARDIKQVAEEARRLLAAHAEHHEHEAGTPALHPAASSLLYIAERYANEIADRGKRAHLLAEIAELLAEVDPEHSLRVAEGAETLIGDIDDHAKRAEALARIAAAVVRTDPRRADRLTTAAERIALAITDGAEAISLVNVFPALALTDTERAGRVAGHVVRLAEAITDKESKATLTAATAWGAATASLEWAEQLAERGEDLADIVAGARSKGLALAYTAAAYASVRPQRVAPVANRVETIADKITHPRSKGTTLAVTAFALAETDVRHASRMSVRAESLVGAIIAEEGGEAPSLASIGAALARANPHRAEPFAVELADTYTRANTLTMIARVWLKGSMF